MYLLSFGKHRSNINKNIKTLKKYNKMYVLAATGDHSMMFKQNDKDIYKKMKNKKNT